MAKIYDNARISEFPFNPNRLAEDLFTVINYERLTEELREKRRCLKEDKWFYEDRVIRELSKLFSGMSVEEIRAKLASL